MMYLKQSRGKVHIKEPNNGMNPALCGAQTPFFAVTHNRPHGVMCKSCLKLSEHTKPMKFKKYDPQSLQTFRCKAHPKYKAKRPPKDCPVCHYIYTTRANQTVTGGSITEPWLPGKPLKDVGVTIKLSDKDVLSLLRTITLTRSASPMEAKVFKKLALING
jgi:hypothetical protein